MSRCNGCAVMIAGGRPGRAGRTEFARGGVNLPPAASELAAARRGAAA